MPVRLGLSAARRSELRGGIAETCLFFHFRGFQTLAIFEAKRCVSQKRNGVWLGAESNRRHEDFQSSALPTELPSRIAMPLLLKREGGCSLKQKTLNPQRRVVAAV